MSALPSHRLALLQSEWLQPARSRVLRMADVGRAERIVDLACGWGQVTVELAERSNARVVGVDHSARAIEFARSQSLGELRDRVEFTQADATALTIEDHSQDIVFIQCGLMWMRSAETVLAECHRVLRPGGYLVAMEPDFGGMMEYPAEMETREIWLAALDAAGANPRMGRQLPVICHAAGFEANSLFLDRYEPYHPESLSFLSELSLSPEQQLAIRMIEAQRSRLGVHRIVVHLPFWVVVAKTRR